MHIKKSYILGATLVVSAVALAWNAFQATLTPYVTVAEAKSSGRSVQVAGIVIPGSQHFDLQTNNLYFTLREDGGAQMVVVFDGAKPANFETATKVVAVGRYEERAAAFMARELLIKCPTKYKERVKGK
jgi:cytochrome c-type biogenesis protein CcmE